MTTTPYDGSLAVLFDAASNGGRGRGILFMAAHLAEPKDVNRMATDGRGVCTITINEAAAARLRLAPQGAVPRQRDVPYLVNSIEAVACSETGISAAERALTLRVAGNPEAVAEDLVTPGHIMVQVARNVLRDRASLPEIANALLSAYRIARFSAWSDILDDSGEVGSATHCRELAERLTLPYFEAPAAIAFARRELAAWTAAVEFSDAMFG